MRVKALKIIRPLLFACALVAVAGASFAGPLEDGQSAFDNDDYATAMKLLRPLAEGGDAIAQFYLARMFDEGWGVPVNDVEAVKWYRRAADQGDADAQNILGVMYRDGEGVAKSDAEAVKWFRLAAEQGQQYGQFNLAQMYDDGVGVKLDDAEAVKWYRRAADQGNADAQNVLGVMYRNGEGVAQSNAEAVKWFRLAAEQGQHFGQFNLAQMYDDGVGVKLDDAEAVKWYRRAADQGDADAQNVLGVMYRNGEGVTQSNAEAVKWYRLAAEQGNEFGQLNLAGMYEDGLGVPKNGAEAVKWYRLAAGQGNTDAKDALASMNAQAGSVATKTRDIVVGSANSTGAASSENSADYAPPPSGPGPEYARAAARHSGDPMWIQDPQSQCWLFNPNPQAGESVNWGGNCSATAEATGHGTITWFKNGAWFAAEAGEMRNGKMVGDWSIRLADGRFWDSFWVDGVEQPSPAQEPSASPYAPAQNANGRPTDSLDAFIRNQERINRENCARAASGANVACTQ